ncbi:Uncharacterised protein [Mycolicibacterium tokaiense]|uniref:Uncharacterized protein n=1 Tax=Mycolicibacterium tokaiense TaxID=39695 RepID=A0A378T9Z0_9MYCO|nr:Uncharacterised protein [Mycolicibacterium tokaiense]
MTQWPAYSKAGVMSVRRKSMRADAAERELIETEHQLAQLDMWNAKRKAKQL